ncbi:hypothetical protein IFM89_006865 [Coptis chinensis]|uniref:Uncharacterized protein n=1 Tax=Coptis chinensis TaxID=261450 RepID=A0A835GUW0_9MAGN|nr:hypothetical protein IFM89_006865 [Coptis chinensis]
MKREQSIRKAPTSFLKKIEKMSIAGELGCSYAFEPNELTVKSIDSFSSPSSYISLSLASLSCSPTSSAGTVNSKSKNAPSSSSSSVSSVMWWIVVVGLVLVLVLGRVKRKFVSAGLPLVVLQYLCKLITSIVGRARAVEVKK